jgi:hypothetical protein
VSCPNEYPTTRVDHTWTTKPRSGCLTMTIDGCRPDDAQRRRWPILRYMDATIYNVAALTFSLIAILISGLSARRQAADVRCSNLMIYMTELGRIAASADFRDARNYVLTELSQFDPALGVYGLPKPVCDYALQVGGFYQDMGALVLEGVIEEELVVALHYTGIKEAWRALEPYIRGERVLRRAKGLGGFFGAFEHLAVYVYSVPHEKVRRKIRRRSFPDASVDSFQSGGQSDDTAPATTQASDP